MDVYGVPAENYISARDNFNRYYNNPDLFLDDWAAANNGDQAAWERYNHATTYTDIVLGMPNSIEKILPLTEEQIQARIDSAYGEGDVLSAQAHTIVLASHLGIDGFHDADFQGGGATAAAAVSIRALIRGARLPNRGSIRYIPPSHVTANTGLPRGPKNGYIDKFGNEWTRGPSRTAGEPFEWDVQLSRTGRAQLGHLSRDGNHLNVSLLGWITHR